MRTIKTVIDAEAPPIRRQKITCNMESLTYLVCEKMYLPVERVFEKTRKREVVYARFVIAFFAGQTTDLPKKHIINYLSLRCHSGFDYAIGQVTAFCYTDSKFKALINKIADDIDPRLKEDFDWNK